MRIERWVSGYHAELSEWLNPGEMYLNIQYYSPGTRFPEDLVWEKSFVLRTARPELLANFFDSLVEGFAMKEERRDERGNLIPIGIMVPPIAGIFDYRL